MTCLSGWAALYALPRAATEAVRQNGHSARRSHVRGTLRGCSPFDPAIRPAGPSEGLETRILPSPGNWRSTGSTKALVERFRLGCTNHGPRRASPLVLTMEVCLRTYHAEGFTTDACGLAEHART